ncbi:beta-ketoacyl reductase, partial [Streptomyces sp. 6N223]|uniref:beta-ketoacyl reductase n=1 Tax=Streptomyces sp. 6N223 TaxID=3457412 RepID=UPI003FD0974F
TRDQPHTLLTALATLHTHHAATPNWNTLLPHTHLIPDLPTYPFQHQHHWLTPSEAQTTHDTLNSWRYAVTWRAHTPSPQAALNGTWLLLTPPDAPPPADLVNALEAAGAATTTNPAHPALAGVLNLDPDPAAVLALLHAQPSTPLWTVTTGAVRVSPHDDPPHPAHAQTWGLGRVAALEYPHHFAGLIDLPHHPEPHHYALLTRHLAAPTAESQLAIRDDTAHVPRLTRAPLAAPPAAAAYHPRHTTLVSGGTTGTGLLVARHLARAGAEHLLLTHHPQASPADADALTAELVELGAGAVTIAVCDITDRDAVCALLSSLPPERPPLAAVIHTAEADTWSTLADLTPDGLADVLSVRAGGAQLLHDLTLELGLSLEAFVLFSSVAGVWGSAGQGAHAAAVAHLDALAQARRAAGLPGTSLAWGPWAEAPIGAVDPAVEGERLAQLERRGLTALPTELALAALQQALDHDETFVAVADVDWARFAPLFTSARPGPLLSGLPEVAGADDDGPDGPDSGSEGSGSAFAERVARLSPEERRVELVALVRAASATVLGHAGAEAVEPQRPFRDLGFDSLAAVSLRNQLGVATGLRLPATLVFDHPTPVAVAEFLIEEFLMTEADGGGATGEAGETGLFKPPPMPASALASDTAEVAEAVDGFTDDELFAFIDDRLGTFRLEHHE